MQFTFKQAKGRKQTTKSKQQQERRASVAILAQVQFAPIYNFATKFGTALASFQFQFTFICPCLFDRTFHFPIHRFRNFELRSETESLLWLAHSMARVATFRMQALRRHIVDIRLSWGFQNTEEEGWSMPYDPPACLTGAPPDHTMLQIDFPTMRISRRRVQPVIIDGCAFDPRDLLDHSFCTYCQVLWSFR